MSESLRAGYETKVATESPYMKNKVFAAQKRFSVADGLPVFLKGKHDVRLYRGIMVFSVLGIAISIGSIYMMAMGTVPKKER